MLAQSCVSMERLAHNFIAVSSMSCSALYARLVRIALAVVACLHLEHSIELLSSGQNRVISADDAMPSSVGQLDLT